MQMPMRNRISGGPKDPPKKSSGFVPDPNRELTPGASLKPLASDQPVVDWWASYVSSPKYKQRLSAFYQYPGYIQRQRASILGDVAYRENPSNRSAYYENGNEIAMSNMQIKALNTTREEVMSHELGHSVNANSEVKAARLNPKEEEFILQRNKQVSPATLNRYRALSKETGQQIGELMSDVDHDTMPKENLSDIQSLRYLLKQRKIYDAGKDDVTPEVIRKAANDPVIRKSFIWKRIKESFDEKGLSEIMNAIAVGKSNKKLNIA